MQGTAAGMAIELCRLHLCRCVLYYLEEMTRKIKRQVQDNGASPTFGVVLSGSSVGLLHWRAIIFGTLIHV